MSAAPATAAPGGLPGDVLVGRYGKTEAGRAEIRNRALPLSRPARNLLLIIDASRNGEGWLGLVQGCGPADLAALRDAGLVAEATAAAPLAGRMSLAQALETKGYLVLYQRITAQARPRLGLLKSYRLVLEVERCSGPVAIRALAQRFVEQVREADGDAAAIALAQVLIAPD
jgi:hypothetical protein